MKIDLKTVDRLAELARLEFEDKAKEEILSDLNKILDFVDKLNELDTENVEPLIYMTEGSCNLREDKVEHLISQQEALKNAPDKDSDYIKVAKVIEKK